MSSKAKFNILKDVQSGKLKVPGLDKTEASNFTTGKIPSNVPKGLKGSVFTKLRKYLKTTK